jgi:hypothetical protein
MFDKKRRDVFERFTRWKVSDPSDKPLSVKRQDAFSSLRSSNVIGDEATSREPELYSGYQ